MRLFAVTCLLLIGLTACEPDVEEVAPPELTGRWELERAYRNNMETQTLGNLYFEFREGDSLRTNLLGEDQHGTYAIDDTRTEIVTRGVKVPLNYTVRELTDTTLLLRSNYQGFRFDFEMRRVGVQSR